MSNSGTNQYLNELPKAKTDSFIQQHTQKLQFDRTNELAIVSNGLNQF